MNDLLTKLYDDISDEGVQRTKGIETKKGYDTTGYGYQYIVDRFNYVFGFDWGFDWKVFDSREGEYSSGRKYYEITVETTIWVRIDNDPTVPIVKRSCVGGHISSIYADALKGAITNSFKKTAGFFGVGADAFRGQIDEDNKPIPDSFDNKTTEYKWEEIEPELDGKMKPTQDFWGRMKKLKSENMVRYEKDKNGVWHFYQKVETDESFNKRQEKSQKTTDDLVNGVDNDELDNIGK